MTIFEQNLLKQVSREIGQVDIKHFRKAVEILENANKSERSKDKYLEELVIIINRIQSYDRR